MHSYTPRGVCSRQIDVEVNGDTVESVQFTGGCDGNLKAISKLVAGMKVDDVAALLEGNTCAALFMAVSIPFLLVSIDSKRQKALPFALLISYSAES